LASARKWSSPFSNDIEQKKDRLLRGEDGVKLRIQGRGRLIQLRSAEPLRDYRPAATIRNKVAWPLSPGQDEGLTSATKRQAENHNETGNESQPNIAAQVMAVLRHLTFGRRQVSGKHGPIQPKEHWWYQQPKSHHGFSNTRTGAEIENHRLL
jgi:hypothetical protein